MQTVSSIEGIRAVTPSALTAIINSHLPREQTSAVRRPRRRAPLTIVAEVVAHDIGVTVAELLAKSRRNAMIVAHRPLAMYLAYEMNEGRVSTTRVAMFFKRSDHTTVLHAIRVVNERRRADPAVQALLDALRVVILAVCEQLALSDNLQERALLDAI